MKNTYNVGLLRRRILDAVRRPLSESGAAAVEAFLALPGASAWRPERLGLRELSYLFDIGLPFALIGENPSAKWHALRVGEAVRYGAYPDADEWRDVHAGALLSRLGAAVHFGVDAKSQPHGLEWQLPDGTVLDVEVAHAAAPRPSESRARPYLLAIDVRGGDTTRLEAALRNDMATSPQCSGALLFEPRFWIGVEQKEWRYAAHLNRGASVPVPRLGAEPGWHALRIVLAT